MKFCPGGQSEIRLAPGEIGSGEPVKLLPSAAGGYDKPTPSWGATFPQPFGLPFFITTAAMRRRVRSITAAECAAYIDAAFETPRQRQKARVVQR